MTAPLISPERLQALLDEGRPSVRVLDARFNLADPAAGEQAWRTGHIPGALYAHLDRDLSGRKNGLNGRHPLPEPAGWQTTLQHWGIQPDTPVVVYDDAGGMFAARLWWMLRHWTGHAQVQVLDGGWPTWVASGAAVSTQSAPAPDPCDAAFPVQDGAIISTDEIAGWVTRPGHTQLIDARAPDRFRGENETLDPVGGHIPGALNRFFQHNLQPGGRFKAPDVLRQEWTERLGHANGGRVIHQCGSGVTACHNLLAMDIAGLPGSKLYAGSWSAWCADPGRPVARGD